MIVQNVTQGSLIASRVKRAISFSDRLRGMMKLENAQGLLFKSRFGIHTFGMREKIDVLVLDRNYRVVRVKTALSPRRFFFWNPRYFYLLELPAGAIFDSRTRMGDVVRFDESG